MRKYHQEQLLELIKTLSEAHDEIKRLFSAQETQAVIGLLSECQESALQIGKFIEQLEGEGTKTVACLEEYCETLYRIGVGINDFKNAAAISKQLKKQLIPVENSIRTDLRPNKIEMVFLPYKASMWDSMESVWRAAKDDPQCDVYVVPIPYYDRLPDRTFGQMHYEGGQYPEEVPVLDWQTYDLEKRRPDIVVSHNPYDDENYVTSVHPLFYSKRLKGLTDLLVYIPYFVCMDDVPEHFCTCAAIRHADMVVVQSERIRETYLRAFRNMEKGRRGGAGNAKSKFVALGSPKFDKVISTKREDCQIPDAWRKLIEQPDGTRKKVVLYNTSIAELLEGKEKILRKLRSVFDCFKDRDDIVLLWRPHPLSAAVYECMRPQLLDKYQNIVAEYKRQGFGIYDDTTDLHRAIAISDAYYGDWSSLTALSHCAGKPGMIQSPEVLPETEGLHGPAFENLYDDGESLWFTAYDFNALFKMSKQTWEAEYIGSFPGEKADGFRLYGSITAHNGKLYFAPCYAKEIAAYDPVSNQFCKISFDAPKPQPKVRYLPAAKFYAAVPYKDWVFFVGCSYPAFLRYNTVTGQLDYFSDWVEHINKQAHDDTDIYFRQAAVANGSCFAAAAGGANAVVLFDMDACKSTVYKLGNSKCGYSGICFDGKDYWLSPRHDGAVVKWNPDTKTQEEYTCFPDGFLGGKYSFWNINYAQDCVWLFPQRANMALKIDVLQGIISAAEAFEPECRYEKTDDKPWKSNYIFSKPVGDILYAHTGKSNRLIEYHCKTGYRREEPVSLSPQAKTAVKQICMQAFVKDTAACKTVYDSCFYEKPFLTLDDFLNYLVRHGESEHARALRKRQFEIFKERNNQADGTSGAAIFLHCKQGVIH